MSNAVDMMPDLCNVADFQSLPQDLAIFVGKTGEDQHHCGILYKSSPGSQDFNALHLAWHADLQNHTTWESLCEKFQYYFVLPAINRVRSATIAAACRRIWQSNKRLGLPYGLHYDNTSFDLDSGMLMLSESQCGLTCATFILAVFWSEEVKLIDAESWPARVEDKSQHQKILNLLTTRSNASAEHIAKVTKEVGCARFRPEEVAASAAFSPQPAASAQIIERGDIIRQSIA
jgi:hypothetical protein